MSSNVTLKDIAQVLGISMMSVSRALNNRPKVSAETRQKVLKTAERMGYTPNHIAKSLVYKKTLTIGVIIPKISHDFFAKVISGIEEVAYTSGYQLILTNSAEDYHRERKVIETLWSKRVDGILISCSETTQDFSYYKKVIAAGIPMVFFDRWAEGLDVSTVRVDDKVGAKRVTEHMIGHGYKKIACLRGSGVSMGKERYEGFLEAMRTHQIPVNDKWILESGFTEEGGYKAMKKLLKLSADDRPEAVVVVNDPASMGVFEAIEEAGLSVPGDIAICGFGDDIRAPILRTPLTTVHQPAEDMGKQAVKKLIDLIENKNVFVENIELKTKLMIRTSCGCQRGRLNRCLLTGAVKDKNHFL